MGTKTFKRSVAISFRTQARSFELSQPGENRQELAWPQDIHADEWVSRGVADDPVIEVRASTRRHCLAIYADGLTWYSVADTPGGFGWAGGSPSTPIDLEDLPNGAYVQRQPRTTFPLTVTTTRLEAGALQIASGGEAAWVFSEGEEEESKGVWPGRRAQGI